MCIRDSIHELRSVERRRSANLKLDRGDISTRIYRAMQCSSRSPNAVCDERGRSRPKPQSKDGSSAFRTSFLRSTVEITIGMQEEGTVAGQTTSIRLLAGSCE